MTTIKDDVQLAYWAQGYFEIAGTNELTEAQAKAVAKAANAVEQKGELAKFIVDHVLDNGFDSLGSVLAAKLEEKFHHDIDPSYEGDQDQFDQLHGGDPNGPVMRC